MNRPFTHPPINWLQHGIRAIAFGTVATREPSQSALARPSGRVSTIAKIGAAAMPALHDSTGEAGASNLSTFNWLHIAVGVVVTYVLLTSALVLL